MVHFYNNILFAVIYYMLCREQNKINKIRHILSLIFSQNMKYGILMELRDFQWRINIKEYEIFYKIMI